MPNGNWDCFDSFLRLETANNEIEGNRAYKQNYIISDQVITDGSKLGGVNDSAVENTVTQNWNLNGEFSDRVCEQVEGEIFNCSLINTNEFAFLP